jgi:hypothetical protein
VEHVVAGLQQIRALQTGFVVHEPGPFVVAV